MAKSKQEDNQATAARADRPFGEVQRDIQLVETKRDNLRTQIANIKQAAKRRLDAVRQEGRSLSAEELAEIEQQAQELEQAKALLDAATSEAEALDQERALHEEVFQTLYKKFE